MIKSCFSNKAQTPAEYVEVCVTASAVRLRGQNRSGFCVHSYVFSKASKYDGLVDHSKCYLTLAEAMAAAKKLGQQYGLTEDQNLAHRKRVFAI